MAAAAPDRGDSPLPGDPAPPLAVGEWLHEGLYHSVRPGAGGRLLTVIEFWTSWCPLCRTVLPMHDDLQARLEGEGVRFLAISPEEPEAVQAYLRRAGLKHLAVACDDREATLDRYRDPTEYLRIPFAIVIEGNAAHGLRRVLWRGPVIPQQEGRNGSDAAHTRRFDEVLPEVIEGRFDVPAARERERTREQLSRLQREIVSLGHRGDLDELASTGREFLTQQWPEGFRSVCIETLTSAAWLLVSAPEPTKDQAATGLELIRAALRAAPEEGWGRLHIYARALFETGEIGEAVATQRRAVESFEEGDSSYATRSDCLEALSRYEKALREARGEQAEPAAAETAAEAAPSAEDAGKTRPAGRDVLTSEEAAQDLMALHDHLPLNYAAYDDTAWRLAGRGSSWDEHNACFVGRLQQQDEWPLADFFDLMVEYLRVTQDRHLSVKGTFSRGERHGTWQGRPCDGLQPYFADIRLRQDGERMVVIEAPDDSADLQSAEVLHTPVIGSPRTAEAGRAYLFPTLPGGAGEGAADTAKEYLIGALARAADAPERIRLTVSRPAGGSSGRPTEVDLPLHRGRVPFDIGAWDDFRRAAPWSLSLEPIPVVAVRRMWGEGLDDMPDSARQVRGLPVVVLDLRANGGGGSYWAERWCSRLTAQPLCDFAGGANLRLGEADPLKRWDSWLHGSGWPIAEQTEASAPAQTFAGRLFVITDTGVASSGESFTTMASQIEGAIVVGENTGGFGTYGNVNLEFEMPNSRLRVHFGHSKFVLAERPFREGVGFFPDYWLDTDDPVASIMEYCGLAQ